MAEVLGVASTVVSKLYAQRTIVQNGKRGRYDLTDAVPKYIQSIRTSGTAEAGERLKIQQERKLRLLNDATAGDLVKISDAAEVFRAACISWRAGASAIPRRLATELSNTSDAAKCRDLLANEIDELYGEFEKGIRERFGADAVSPIENPAPTKPRRKRPTTSAKKNARPMGGRKPNPTPRKRGTRKVAK
jgi:hypothetical protein